jgi:cell division protein FtsI/penicillin-binding protein 2
MQRRQAISVLLGAFAHVDAKASGSLDRFLGSTRGAAVLVDIRSRRLIAAGGPDIAARSLMPPGSTLKPLVVAALLRSGKLSADASFPCPRRLRIGNRTLDCSHPVLAESMRIDTALAYSCNCFIAHAAQQFGPGELAQALAGSGLASRTSWFGNEEAVGAVRSGVGPDAQRLQALGEDGILITTAGLAAAYRLLALKINSPEMQPVLDGLEGAVEFGTAQNARVSVAASIGTPGGKLAGKTGSVLTSAGEPIAWFAGFWPSRAPGTVITVMVPGHSGGADAAPIAGRILEAYRAGRL